MKFRIDFNPFRGAEYFTVPDHRRRLKNEGKRSVDIDRIEGHVRSIFNIGGSFDFFLVDRSLKPQLQDAVGLIHVIDDPYTGMRALKPQEDMVNLAMLSDLSYSFPDVPLLIDPPEVLLIDPGASLCVPMPLVMVFLSKNNLFEYHTEDQDRLTSAHALELNILACVMDDVKERGYEFCLRETNYKAAVLYQLIESNPNLTSFISKELRSKTCITARCERSFAERIAKLRYEFFIQDVQDGSLITIGNYLTHSKEAIEMFADRVEAL